MNHIDMNKEVPKLKLTLSSREIALCSILSALGFLGQVSGFRIPISTLYSVSPLAATAQVLAVIALPPLLSPIVYFMTFLPLPGLIPYSIAYCPTAALLSIVYYKMRNWSLRFRLPVFAFTYWGMWNLANLLDTYIESVVLGWFPMSAYWYWYFYWLLFGGWIHTVVVPTIIMTGTLRSIDKWIRPDWFDRWRKNSK
jgi:hypothetical protein